MPADMKLKGSSMPVLYDVGRHPVSGDVEGDQIIPARQHVQSFKCGTHIHGCRRAILQYGYVLASETNALESSGSRMIIRRFCR